MSSHEQPDSSPAPGSPLIDIRNVYREYPNGTYGVHDVSLTIGAGEFVTIVGKSGSGKSTLLNIIGLLDVPTAGSYRLGGFDTATASSGDLANLRAQYIGFVFQSFYLLPTRTVAANVEMGSLYQGTGQKVRQEQALRLLESVGLSHRAGSTTATLSGGEMQRAAIARALMGDPQLLLCDEPTGNLDSENATVVLNLIQELNDRGMSVALITHDNEIAARADRSVMLSDGAVVRGIEG